MGWYQGIKSRLAEYWDKGSNDRQSSKHRASVDSLDGNRNIIHLAKLPSRYLVDLDVSGEQDCSHGSTIASNACELVHLMIQNVELDCQWVPKRHKNTLKTFCTVSIGKQTYVGPDTKAMPQDGGNFSIDCQYGATFVLNHGGATKARIAVYCRGKLDGALKNRFIGYGTIDLGSMILMSKQDKRDGKDGEQKARQDGQLPGHLYEAEVDILEPSGETSVGFVTVQARSASVDGLEEQMWERLLSLGDWDETNGLDYEEFQVVLRTFGTVVPDSELLMLFERARGFSTDPDCTRVDIQSLAKSLAHDGGSVPKYLPTCPVDGAEFSSDPIRGASNILYCWLALSHTIGDTTGEMKAGYVTESEAARAWALHMSEWKSHPVKKMQVSAKKLGGLRLGSAAQHILVFDRETKQVIEEIVSPVVLLAMRTLYQSKIGRQFLRNHGFLHRMHELSVAEGRYRDSTESKKEIKEFVDSFRGQLDMAYAEKPMSEYKTFNEFFARKLKAGARPICGGEDIITSAADCRIQVYETVDEATRFWIKGRNFSVSGLLGDDGSSSSLSRQFFDGSMSIFRLAPQDYHRYHSPVSGTIKSITDIPGHLLTVNPIAINCKYADVFTVNKRSVMVLDTPQFGIVSFVAVGATLVGSIVWTAKVGDTVSRGDELGYFKFGGSTCITLFMPGCVEWDADLAANSNKSLETLIKMGDHIGLKAGSASKLSKSDTLDRKQMLEVANQAADEAGILALDKRPSLLIPQEGLTTPLDSAY
jgi:phosphatidylserine decarboxylase